MPTSPRHSLSIGFRAWRRSSSSGLERRYGERVALAGVTRARGGGPDARGARRQRRRQDDAAARARRRCCARTAAARACSARRCPDERWRLPGAGGLPGPRAAALPRADRRARTCATTPACTAWPTRAWTTRARRGGHGAPRRRAGARALARAWSSASPSRAPSCTSPPLLLLDEPRANLDPAAAELLEPLIGRASGRTRVLVSHDVEGALAEADVALGLQGAARPGAACDAELYR